MTEEDPGTGTFSSEEVASVLAAVADGVTVQDQTGHLVYANDAAARIMGFTSAEELLKTPVPELLKRFLILGEDGEPFPLERLPGRLVLEGNQAPPTVLRYLNLKTEAERWSLVRALPVLDDHGKAKYAVNVFTDITEMKQSEHEAALTAARLTAVLNTAINGIITIDQKGVIQTVNPAIERIFGYKPEELTGKSISTLMPEPYRSEHASYLKNYLRTGDAKVIGSVREVQGRKKDGTVFPIDIAVSETVVGEERFFTGIVRDISERKDAERALHQYAEQARLAVEAGEIGIWEYDMSADVPSFDAKCRELFDLPPDGPFSAEDLRQRVHPDDVDRIAKSFLDALDSQTPAVFDEEYRIVLPGGKTRWLASRGEAHFEVEEGNRQVARFVGTIRDMTVRRQAEEALRASEERYRAIIESQVEMVSRFRPDGTILFVNNAYARARGTTPENLTGANFWDFVDEEDRPSVRAMLDKLRPESPDVRIENRFETSEGVRWTFWVNRGLAFDADGRVTEVQSSGIDITDRKQAEQALQESESQFRGTFDNAAVGIVHVGTDRRLLRINKKFCEITGYEEQELLGRDVHDITPEEDRALNPQRAEALNRGELDHTEIERRYIHKKGHLIWAKVTSSIQRDQDGNALYRISVLEDISNRKRLEMRAAAEHAVSQVIATARTLDDAMPQALEALCRSLDVEIAELWIPADGDESIQCSHIRTSSTFEESAEEWSALTATVRFRAGEGLPGIVWESKSPRWLIDVNAGPPSPRKTLAHRLGISSNMAFPLMSGDRCLGVICLHSRQPLMVDDLLQDSLSSLGHDIGQFILRENAEAALRASEALFRETFENTAVGITHIDMDGTLLSVNRKFCEIVGYSQGELLGIDIFDITHEEDRFQHQDIDSLIQGMVDHLYIEKRYINKSGNVVWAKVTTSVRRDGAGNPLHWITVVEDISDRKRAEMRLAAEHSVSQVLATERTLHEAAPQVLDALWRSLDADLGELWLPADDGESIYCAYMRGSDSFGDISEWRDLTATVRFKAGEPLPGLVWGNKSAEWLTDVTATWGARTTLGVRLGIAGNMAFPLMAGDTCLGVICLHTCHKLVIDSELQNALSSLGRDIGQFMLRERAESALLENEERLRLASDAGGIGVWDYDIPTGVVKWSAMLESIFGLPPGGFDGTFETYSSLLHPEDRDQVLNTIRLAFDEEPEYTVEHRILHPSGELRWVHGHGTVVRDSSGKPVRVIGVSTDITDRKRREETQRFLTDASALLTSSLDYNATLRRIAEIAVPSPADWCAVDLLGPDGAIQRVAVTHKDPAKVAFAHELGRRYPPDESSGLREVIATREPVLVPHVTEEMIHATARDDEHLRIIKELGLRSAMIVPLAAGDDVYGTLTLIAAESGRVYDAADLEMAKELGFRCALAITNARLYSILSDSETQFRETFENAAVGITRVGLDRKIIRVNPKFCEITGYDEEELIGKDIFDITPEEDRKVNPQTDALYRGEVGHIDVEKRYIHKDGRLVWVKSTIAVQRDSDGNPIYRISIIEDISDRKRAEMRLAAEHAVAQIMATAPSPDEAIPRTLEALCETLDMVIGELWVSPDEGKTIYCSHIYMSDAIEDQDKWKEVAFSVRFTAGEHLLGKVWESKAPRWRINLSEGPQSPRRDLALNFGISGNMAFPLIAGERCMGIIFLQARRQLVADGMLQSSLSSLGHDIGQFLLREQAEAALRESEERFRFAVRATNDVIWDWDLKTRQIRWNDAVTRLFGYEIEGEATTDDWWREKVHPDDLARANAVVEKAIASDTEVWTVEYRLRRADGTYAHVVNRGHLIRDLSGNVVRMIGATQDVTERTQWEEALRQANQTLEQRVRERTSELEILTTRLRLLATELTDAEQRERRRLAQMMHDHLQQLLVASKMRVEGAITTLVDGQTRELLTGANELLEQSVNASRSLTAELRPPVLYEGGVIAAFNWLARWMESTHRISISIDADPAAEPPVDRGGVLLFESVRELLLNVVKYAETDHAEVKLERLPDDWICITVSDNGKGFDPNELEKTPVGSGGFGLFSIRERLQVLGGHMELVSAPGQGTTVRLFARPHGLNVETPETARPEIIDPVVKLALKEKTPVKEAAGTIRVLLADDHQLVREGLARLLESAGDIMVVGEVSDGQQAVNFVRSVRPDVVVMDVNMPVLNGIEATRAIKNDIPEIHVIGLSVQDDEETASVMCQAGASDFLPKNGPADQLISAIRQRSQSPADGNCTE